MKEQQTTQGRTATIGTFDGLHKGHLLVLETVKEEARRRGTRPCVFTFDRHPLEVVAPHRAPKRLMLPEEEQERLEGMGLEVVVVPFTRDLMHTSASEWMQRLHDDYGVESLVMGYDNTFGSDGVTMSLQDYMRLGTAVGVEVISAAALPGVCSSELRRIVSRGDVESANALMIRPYTLEGTVVKGDGLGRTLGYPTANLQADLRLVAPTPGVYSATVLLPDGTEGKAVVNIGCRPSVTEQGEMRIEAHIIGYTGDLYGERLSLRLEKRLRDEIRFDSVQHLKEAIKADVEHALEVTK